MPLPEPRPITPAEQNARRSRVARIARNLGFVGRVEYRHVYSQTGGAQYGRASAAEYDLLTVYAEAFERDANPQDFSLDAIIAHERGHQILARHPRIGPRVRGRISAASEEVLASLLGAIICPAEADHDALIGKATVELIARGVSPKSAVRQTQGLLNLLRELL